MSGNDYEKNLPVDIWFRPCTRSRAFSQSLADSILAFAEINLAPDLEFCWSAFLVTCADCHQRLCRSDYRQGGSIIQIGLGLSLHCPLLFLVWARLLLWKPYQGFQVTLRLISLVWKVWRFFEGLKYWNRFEDFFPIQRRGSCMSLQKKVTWECFLFILKPLLEGGQILSNWVGEHLSSTLSVSARRPTVLHTGCWKFPQVCSAHHRKLLFISSNY